MQGDNDRADPVTVARRYLDALAQGDFERAAACMDEGDLAAWHAAIVEAASHRKQVMGVDETRRFAGPFKSVEAFTAATPVAAFASVLASTSRGPDRLMDGLPPVKLTLTDVGQSKARAHYVYASEPGHPLSEQQGALELRLQQGSWSVGMRGDPRAIVARERQESERFRAARAGDRATFTPWQDLYPVQLDDLWGYMDRAGRLRIQPRFRRAHGFCEGLAAVRIASDWGYIDHTGKPVIAPRFGSADDFDESGYAPAGVREDFEARVGLIDREGRYAIAPEYESLVLCGAQGLVLCEREGQFRALSLAGKPLSDMCDEPELAAEAATDGAYHFDDDSGQLVPAVRDGELAVTLPEDQDCHRVYLVEDEAYALVNGELELLSDLYPLMGRPSDGRVAVCAESLWGYLDSDGREVIPLQFDAAEAFADGRAAVRQDELWGYIDSLGQFVVEPAFEVAWDFVRGLARVETDEGMGYIDPTGAFVWRPSE